jgi:hypothetical protein
MKGLGKFPTQQSCVSDTFPNRKHVMMAFQPRRVGNLGHNAVELHTIGMVAIVDADRIKAVTPIPKLREQANGSQGAFVAMGLDSIADTFCQITIGIT